MKRLLATSCMLCIVATLFAVKVEELRCEQLVNPLGVGTAQPRLSWKIPAEYNGLCQTAYQVLAASRLENLEPGKADLWDSGKVQTDQTIWVQYGGKPLSSRDVVYWKVCVWDEKDKASEWSKPAQFSIGLLDKGDWKAQFIGMERPDTTSAPMMRKTVRLSELKGEAFLHISTLGYHEVYINNQKVGNEVLAPSVAQINKRTQAMTYRVSHLLHEGDNELVIWLGKGYCTATLEGIPAHGPFVMAQVDVQQANGKWKTVACTDKTWKARESGYYNPGDWFWGQFNGEQVKADMLLPDFTTASLDAVEWQPVVTVKLPDDRKVTPMMCEPNCIQEIIRPKQITRYKDGVWMVDMGKSVVGWTRINFGSLRKGQHIELCYADRVALWNGFDSPSHTDTYDASGSGQEWFCNKFNYHAYRYIQISGLDHAPTANDIEAYSIYTGYETHSSFVCDDSDLNAIHDMIHYTFKCLTTSGYMVDCPHIERGGYGGDGNASVWSAQTMYEMYPLYRNWLQAYTDAQGPEGQMPHAAPLFTRCGGGPFWWAFIANAPWQTYLHYGDVEILRQCYPAMQRFLAYAERYYTDGMLLLKNRWPDSRYTSWFLGDWALPNEDHQAHESSTDLVNCCTMSWVYDVASRIANVLGKTADSEAYAKKHLELNEKIHAKFYNQADQTYAHGLQLDMAFPLFVGAVPKDMAAQVDDKLNAITHERFDGHLFTGLVGVPIVTQWLTRAGDVQLMYHMLKQRNFPGYLYMIENGATTTWEHWNGQRSRIHNCYNGIGSWFYQALGGIVADENAPAYRHFFVRPQAPEGVKFVRVSQPTPLGNITVEWNRSPKSFDLKVSVPVGAKATIELPFEVESAEWPLSARAWQGLIFNDKAKDAVDQADNELVDLSKPVVLSSGTYRILYHLK